MTVSRELPDWLWCQHKICHKFKPIPIDLQWFSDYLSELCEDEHLHHYLHIRVFLTNCDSAPDELASALLQLGLKTAGDKVTARRPSQPQLNNLYHMTSYGLPDFTSLLDCKCRILLDRPISYLYCVVFAARFDCLLFFLIFNKTRITGSKLILICWLIFVTPDYSTVEVFVF